PGMESRGLPSRSEVIERYAAGTGLDVAGVAWYEAFACWKTAVILQQLHTRYLRGESTDERMATRGDRIAGQARRAMMVLDDSGLYHLVAPPSSKMIIIRILLTQDAFRVFA